MELAGTSSAWILSQTETFHTFLYVMGTRGSGNTRRGNFLPICCGWGSQPLGPRTRPTAQQSCGPSPPASALFRAWALALRVHMAFIRPHRPCVLPCFVELNPSSSGDRTLLHLWFSPLQAILHLQGFVLPAIP